MPTNHEDITPNQESANQPPESSEKPNSPDQHDANIGAKILTLSNFDTRNKPIVESSFEKAKKHGEKLPGKNNERRNFAYLSRLEKLIDKHGNNIEKKLWHSSIQEDLLVKEQNITEATWEAKKQEYRDNGHGYVEVTDDFKHAHAIEWRKLQKESLEKWASYLGDEHSPYPLWFKVYAWDGMTKMGVYNKTKREYEKRNETTVAPYPEPDAEILGRMFELVNRYHGNNEREFYTENGERSINLEKMVQSGNFSKIYNAIQQDISPIIEPPEKAEDVHGAWIEYKPGDEDYIAIAAKGTGWCIATSAVARYYLKHGTYGTEKDEEYDNQPKELKSKFILFHLKDPTTGKLSRNAVASIRLDPDGQVAEISGLKDGQALNDSLVQIVEEKVKTLPGGEEFLPKFADKNELICLDRKMQNGEDLTKEELEFIYEIHRPIRTLDTYNQSDPRIKELKNQYDIKYALDVGVEPDNLVSKLEPHEIAKNLDTLINHGANIDNLVPRVHSRCIARSLDTLINHGANIDNLVPWLGSYDIAKSLDAIIGHGANIDIDNLVSRLMPYEIAENLDTLIKHGANIDIDNLVSGLSSTSIASNLDALINHGANIDNLVSKLYPDEIAYKLDTLISHGANIDIDNLVSRLSSTSIAIKLDTLISHGANIDNLVSRLRPREIADNLDTLIKHGANIDPSMYR